MDVWRFSSHESIDGRGGLIASARWHTRGREILYCAPNPATAVLEVLVHAAVNQPASLSKHKFVKIEIPDDLDRSQIDEQRLPPEWSRQLRLTRAWGDRWLAEQKTAICLVRSALVPETTNVLINPRHPQAVRIVRSAVFPYPLDKRLFG